MSLRDYLFYEEPGITLYCGDCREVLPLLHGDAVVTDPPYGLDVEYESHNDYRAAADEVGGPIRCDAVLRH